jgi:hypothetical protein
MDIFQWQFPSGPDDPFGNPTIVVLDCLRILIVLCGVLTVLLTIPALPMTWSITQKYRIGCIALFSIYVSMTEIQRIGDYANWRLLLGAVCSIWAVSSMFAFIRFEGNPDAVKWASWIHRRNIHHDG